MRPTPWTPMLRAAGAALLALAAAACSGSGGSPTAPSSSLPATTGGASVLAAISGNVASVPGGGSRAGIRVSVDSPPLETRTDASGFFRFDGVQPGSRVLAFEAGGLSAALSVGTVAAGQTLRVSVALSSNGATLDSSAGAGSDDPAGDDDGGNGSDDPSGDDGGSGSDDPPGDDQGGIGTTDPLSVDFNPDEWPSDGSVSRGRISARIEGSGFDRIDRTTVVLVGSAGTASPIGSHFESDELEVDFSPIQALAAIGSPAPGTVASVAVRFQLDGQVVTLQTVVVVVAPHSSGSGSGHG